MARMLELGRALILLFLWVPVLAAADYDLDDSRAKFISGDYVEVIQQARAAIEDHARSEDWPLLLAESLWMTGEYEEARQVIEEARRRFYSSIRLRVLGHKIFRSAGEPDEATGLLHEINSLGVSRRFGFRDAVDIVALGQAAVLMGADPKLVLDNFYNQVKKAEPELREVYIAIGNLALGKNDYGLAGQAFQEGLRQFADDPDLLHGLAAALAPSDRKEMLHVIEQVLEANENHVESRLLVAEHLIDAEEYDEAEKELKSIEEINPNRPEMWAFRAVIAHLRTDPDAEESARAAGLRFWKTNPEVDHIIGRKLSQKYRFAEGAIYQRQAVQWDPTYLPAKIQLAQDLLRLGVEEEGWHLAAQVARADAYDVSAYNLITLRETISDFSVLTNSHFILRMAPEEAAVYGRRALDLLERARTQLTQKYGLELTEPVTVEIFPEQKDFAVRTFGMPGGEGYLGVCFGNVITANSPATHTMNWESVLWHEFCHVVTLNLTRNKMPRWLSEGISVYEERRASSRWGQWMNPEYRELIVEGKMTPVSELSSAFMAPPSGMHLQFAYYQSSLVVEFLVERFGLEKMRGILRDLGDGMPINEALEAHTVPMQQLEDDFDEFARALATDFGPDSIWDKPEQGQDGGIDPSWAALHADNFWVLKDKVERLLFQEKPEESIPLLEKSIELFRRQTGEDGAYSVLAGIYRNAKEREREQEVLSEWAKYDGEASDALLRLVELELASNEYEAAKKHAEMLLEINPLHPLPYVASAEAAEKSGEPDLAIVGYGTVLRLDPPDRPEIHFRLARLLSERKDPAAKRHILLALEEAPRFRAAHELLLEIIPEKPGAETISEEAAK